MYNHDMLSIFKINELANSFEERDEVSCISTSLEALSLINFLFIHHQKVFLYHFRSYRHTSTRTGKHQNSYTPRKFPQTLFPTLAQ